MRSLVRGRVLAATGRQVGPPQGRTLSRGRDILQPGDPLLFAGAGLAGYWIDDVDVALNGTTVSAWGDQSGNDYDLSQGVAGAQPLFVAGELNGHNYLRFDGSNDGLMKSGVDMFAGGAYSWVAVVRIVSTVAFKVGFGNAGTVSGGMYYAIHSAAGAHRVTHAGAFDATDGISTTAWSVITICRAAAAAPTLEINGVSAALAGTTTTLNAAVGANIHLGFHTTATFPQPMECAFLAALTIGYSAGQRLAATRWAGNRYGIDVA